MDRRELEALKLQAGSLRSRVIKRALEKCGWVARRGGKHPDVFKKAGCDFSITVPMKMTKGTAVSIINILLDDLDEGGEHDGEH